MAHGKCDLFLYSVYAVVAVIYILLNYLINRLAALIAARTGVRIISRLGTSSF